MNEKHLVGGIELGGTKSLVAVGYSDGSVVERTSLPTVAPQLLVPQIAEYLRSKQDSLGPIEALGVGAFGPIVVDRNASNYGRLLQTNKPGWSDFDLASALRSAIRSAAAGGQECLGELTVSNQCVKGKKRPMGLVSSAEFNNLVSRNLGLEPV
jgi:fructokinase